MVRFALLLALLTLVSACGGDDSPIRTCSVPADCPSGSACVDQRCVSLPDSGATDRGTEEAGAEAGLCEAPERPCGAICCEAGQACGSDDACCAPSELCGGACCQGDNQTCIADLCVIDCGEQDVCGGGCCGEGEVCLTGTCTAPGASCDTRFDCLAGEYCEASIGRCLPRAVDAPECEFVPEPGEFELDEKFHWSGDAEVMPRHNQIMSAAMVANLNDDNGDGNIDENDIPDIVFNSFDPQSLHRTNPTPGGRNFSTYNVDGVLRAISGADGSRLWPTAEPAYFTQPALEVAIADIDPSSPGPEIVGCTFEPGARQGTTRLTIFSATGNILRRFDDDVVVGCGRPSIADADLDGIAEIAVSRTIVKADGSGTIPSPLSSSNSIPFFYNMDDDPELEAIGINGIYDPDGTLIWQSDTVLASEGGFSAVADIDLDGDPDLIAVGTTSHQAVIFEGRTGEVLAGPIEITPLDDTSIAARVEAARAARPERDPLTGGGPPTIANFDDDPEPEIAFAGGYAYVIFENDLTRKWYLETQDQSSRVTGSSVFDFEGDGIAEVLYNDEFNFRTFRGPDGGIYLDRCNTSGTLTEYPIVVDVDNDDHAEIVLVENNYARNTCNDGTPSTTGLRVFAHPRDQWVRTRRIWNQHAYYVTNIDEDGTLPSSTADNFANPRLNNFRQNVQPDGLLDAPDLQLSDLSFACRADLLLRVRVVNGGRAGAPAGVPISFYVDGAFVGRVVTERRLLAGASELVEFAYEGFET
ncbi:MAG: hypothetical protein AAF411_23925, partial [Myxococcota bacterium]